MSVSIGNVENAIYVGLINMIGADNGREWNIQAYKLVKDDEILSLLCRLHDATFTDCYDDGNSAGFNINNETDGYPYKSVFVYRPKADNAGTYDVSHIPEGTKYYLGTVYYPKYVSSNCV
jgi:hypothetical protein